MTGYGRGEVEADGLRISVELRSVNHRFLDLQIKLPRNWTALEPALASAVRARLERGRVEILVKREKLAQASHTEAHIDHQLAARLFEGSRSLARELGVEQDLTIGELLRMPGVVEVREVVAESAEEGPLVSGALDRALDSLIEMREAEGANLQADLLTRLDRVDALRSTIASLAEGQSEVLQARLRARLDDLLEDQRVDPARLAQETAILADRAAVDEELTRLSSHISQAREALCGEPAVGRRLNFLVQEMNREVNTCGAKAALQDISRAVVELKSELEKIREQVANLE
jgi:uncharacterized protein (TIGR00255 family)